MSTKVITKIVHSADSRGYANHGWLESRHTFSFANYYNPERMNFGALRVLNDDIVKGGKGFGTHPHENMEIISIPIEGSLEHKDSTGHKEVINPGEVQIMSAGSGLQHSEYNHSKTHDVNFLQLWIFPKENNIKPGYDQQYFGPDQHENQLLTVVAPDDSSALRINQDAWFSLGTFDRDQKHQYKLKKNGNGLYVFVIEGHLEVADVTLYERDGMGLSNFDSIQFKCISKTKLLVLDIPMKF